MSHVGHDEIVPFEDGDFDALIKRMNKDDHFATWRRNVFAPAVVTRLRAYRPKRLRLRSPDRVVKF